jgi:hypothetical protein
VRFPPRFYLKRLRGGIAAGSDIATEKYQTTAGGPPSTQSDISARGTRLLDNIPAARGETGKTVTVYIFWPIRRPVPAARLT